MTWLQADDASKQGYAILPRRHPTGSPTLVQRIYTCWYPGWRNRPVVEFVRDQIDGSEYHVARADLRPMTTGLRLPSEEQRRLGIAD